jgi:hypothetical protein
VYGCGFTSGTSFFLAPRVEESVWLWVYLGHVILLGTRLGPRSDNLLGQKQLSDVLGRNVPVKRLGFRV